MSVVRVTMVARRPHQKVGSLPITYRDLHRDDLPAIEGVLDRTGLFPAEMLRPMAEPWLSGSANHHWRVVLDGPRPVGFAYVEPERMTEGTFNLLAIAVDPEEQGRGLGKGLVSDVIARIRDEGGRLFLVETSSLDDYSRTRAFYDGQGFAREARIRDFYREGDDKIVFAMRI